MSAKFDKFKAALIALCDEHLVTIAPEHDYDGWVTIGVTDREELGLAINGDKARIGDEALIDLTKQS